MPPILGVMLPMHDSSKEERVRDPVCGMMVLPSTAAGKWDYQGTTYYFCNPRCVERFKADPEHFLRPKPSVPPAVSATGEYTCPMDPEVRQIGPGT